MTKLPADDRLVIGLAGDEYPKYKVGPLCSVPTCSRLADHSHHIWRRSFVIGDKPWVKYPDGTITGNLTGLCYQHHQCITENIDWISWNDWNHQYWYNFGDGSVTAASTVALSPQPPIYGEDPPVEDHDGAEVIHLHGPGSVEKCPACHRAMPRPKEKMEEKRPRKAWTITVPVDKRENGADVLDTLLEECGKVFGHDETKSTRYFTLVQALALVVQHQERMLADE